MGSNNELPEHKKSRFGSLAWIMLGVILILLPLAAIAKLMLASDEELDDVVGQSLLEFSIVNRTVTSPGGNNYVFTPIILKVNAVIIINNVYMSNVRLGYWNTGYDLQIYGESGGGAGTGIVWGARGYPVYMRGLRLELAYDNIYAANPNFLFLRIGTDDFSGCLDLDPDNSSYGSFDRLSYDGRVQSNASMWPYPAIAIDEQFRNDTSATGPLSIEIPFKNVLRLYYHCGPQDEGRTDWFITLADNISDGHGYNNTISWNPKTNVADNVPGRGYWMHFQSLYAAATMDGIWN